MKNILFILSICTVVFISSPASASPRLDDVGDTNHHMMAHKFKRGVINVLTSPGEIPKQIKGEWKKSDTRAGKVVSVFGGTVKGIVYMAGRIGSGLWDVVSFNIALPDDYGPLMKPEYVCPHMNKNASSLPAVEPAK